AQLDRPGEGVAVDLLLLVVDQDLQGARHDLSPVSRNALPFKRGCVPRRLRLVSWGRLQTGPTRQAASGRVFTDPEGRYFGTPPHACLSAYSCQRRKPPMKAFSLWPSRQSSGNWVSFLALPPPSTT